MDINNCELPICCFDNDSKIKKNTIQIIEYIKFYKRRRTVINYMIEFYSLHHKSKNV